MKYNVNLSLYINTHESIKNNRFTLNETNSQ